MLLNVSKLLATNSSRDTISSLLTTQHAVLLPVNALSVVLNGAALLVICRSRSMAGMLAALLISLSLINTLNSVVGALIDLLYFTGNIGCSGNCELTFDPDVDASPGVMVTLLRYSSDVCRSGHFWQMLLSAVHHWLLMTAPLRSEVISRRSFIFTVKALVWGACLLGNVPILVDGFAFGSDSLFFTFRTYALPVVNTVHAVLVFIFYYKLAEIAIRQIGEVAKVEKLQTRFHPRQASLKRQKSHRRKNAHVIQLIVLCFGPFLLTMSPGIYYRAFRPNLAPTLSTVRVLLILDMLPPVHFLLNIIIIGTLNRPFYRILQAHFRSAGHFLCYYFCYQCCSSCSCEYCEEQRQHFRNKHSIKTVSNSNEMTHSSSVRSRPDNNNRGIAVKLRGREHNGKEDCVIYSQTDSSTTSRM